MTEAIHDRVPIFCFLFVCQYAKKVTVFDLGT